MPSQFPQALAIFLTSVVRQSLNNSRGNSFHLTHAFVIPEDIYHLLTSVLRQSLNNSRGHPILYLRVLSLLRVHVVATPADIRHMFRYRCCINPYKKSRGLDFASNILWGDTWKSLAFVISLLAFAIGSLAFLSKPFTF